MKRLIDIIVAIIALLILMPVFIPIMILLRFSAEGEVFYGQERIGYKNRKFRIWKFATMLKNSPNMGTGSLTVRNDPRVTTIGRFLRRSKLNELPQLINLLTGDMTLVGPRPQMKVDFEAYSAEVQAHIYDARPGITGIGSIVFRDEEKLLSVP
ncbi:MAG: sugar transferase [Saprospiraceae bacterium]